VDKPRPAGRSHTRPLVSTRVGLAFCVLGLCLVACAVVSRQQPDAIRLQSLLWVAATAVCSMAGFVCMRSVRTLRTIESELTRTAGTEDRWKAARPLFGSDAVALGWNGLLDAASRNEPATQTRRAAALDQEAITLARAMRGLPIAWIITDAAGAIRFLGPAACGLLGLDEQHDHGGRDVCELLGLEMPPGCVETDAAGGDNPTPDTAGPDRDVAATAAATPEEPASAERLELRKRLLGEVRMVCERLTLRVGQRTVQLRVTRSRLTGRSHDSVGLVWILEDITQQQLASEARDQFLMTATHELRTPLSNLQAYAEALQEEAGLNVERQKEFCNVICGEAVRLGRLVDHLLTVGQMEAGSLVANRHELEISPLIEYAADQVRSQAEQKQMTLSVKLAAKLPTVFGDRDKLQAALVNLAGNAVKYTPDAGEISLRCHTDGQWVLIEVEDNGPGIPEAEQSRVFDKFYRCTDTASNDPRGNGLGLAFVREVARLHDGEIQVESQLGEGSRFTLRLPAGGYSRSGV
jgi:signal transduction histidine kinase